MLLKLSQLKNHPDFIIEYRTPFLKQFGLKVCTPGYYGTTWRAWTRDSTEADRKNQSWKTLSTLCELCSHACGQCEWTAHSKPVPGWRAAPSIIRSRGLQNEYELQTWSVLTCPKFKPGRGRPKAWFVDGVTRLLEAMMEKAREDYIFGGADERKTIERWLLNGPWLTDPEDAVYELRNTARVCDLNPKLKRRILRREDS